VSFSFSCAETAVRFVQFTALPGQQTALASFVGSYIAPIYLRPGFASSVVGGYSTGTDSTYQLLIRFASPTDLTNYLASNVFTEVISPALTYSGLIDTTQPFDTDNVLLLFDTTPATSGCSQPAAVQLEGVAVVSGQEGNVATVFDTVIAPLFLNQTTASSVKGGFSTSVPSVFDVVVTFATLADLNAYVASNAFANVIQPAWLSSGVASSFGSETFQINYNSLAPTVTTTTTQAPFPTVL